VDIHEPSVDDAKLILRGLASYYEQFHSVKFSEEALDAAVDLTHRYVTNAYLPDKAIDVIDNAGARQRVAPADQRKVEIGLPEIEEEVAKVSHIPATAVAEDEATKLGRLEGDLRINVIGQDTALVELVDAVFMQRAGLKEENKPAGSYLFAGPTGVGKTETARTLADTIGVPLFKYDMSEYMEKHSVSRLIGAPPGYVGYGEGDAGAGKLINDIDSHPYCVLLLDEIEKAHPDVFNIFLQVMDDAKLTSASGKEVPFRNVILIMTTNAGAVELTKNSIGFSKQRNADADDPVISRMFPPEFRNRLDAIVKFGSLKPEHMLLIVDKFIKQLDELAGHRSVTLDVDSEAREWLAKKGYDDKMGARPLQRVITDKIKKPLSRMMVTGSLVDGGVAKVRIDGENLLVSV
jgi:ATP-dependent Clp protease ATP-binding subunit ClpA